ncbi:MAG: DUF4397 domain-containing protein [Saprospiraceae bacterium]|uniref:DUF4397 domain-containing protein n=1 Tax=Candidatus Defluviibacterium haderslevense TaxID=2981993 RepID=A0A9D7S6V2_9BACT|nr:DUF4397 domain-containing protein [Candidatus Defluviibacterium haderslevense]MBL0238807.1 DUF4397 domain-containing protein [Candidatus Defluviibacterium haderslevense]
MKTKNLFFWTFAALFVFGIVTSCKKEDDGPLVNPKVAFIHACSGDDVKFLRIFLKDSSVFVNNNVSHPNSIPYASIPEGTHPFNISIRDSSTAFFNSNIPFNNNKNYTLIASNTKAKIELLKLEDNLSVPDSLKTYIRFINLISNSTGVNLLVDSVSIGSNIAYKSVIDFFPIEINDHSIEILQSQTNKLIAKFKLNKAAKGKKYTIYTAGLIGGTGSAIPGHNLMVNN